MTDREWWESHLGDVTTADTAEAHDETVAFLLDRLAEVPDGSEVLDLGCGVGRLAGPVATARHLYVVGIDVSRDAILRAMDNPDVQWMLGDGRTIRWPDETFAAVWSVCLFQHIAAKTAAGYIAEVGRVLVPGGLFVCQFVPPVGVATHQPRLHEHTVAIMEAWCELAGLVVEGSGRGPLYPLWHWLTARKPA